MNQKTIFTVIAAILVLQGIAFYFMKVDIVSSSFPQLDEAGRPAATTLMEVMGVMSVLIGLIAYAARNLGEVLWAYFIGFILFSIISLKHLLLDHVKVPIPAIAIQIIIVATCGFLLMQANKTKA